MEDIKSEEKYILAIDLGGGGPKAAVVSILGEVMGSSFQKNALFLLPRGGAEQDANEWWSSTKKAAKEAIRASGVAPEKIVAISCDSQWSLIVPVDTHGEPLSNAIHWFDTRGGKYNREVVGGFPSVQGYGLFKLLKWIRLTGMAPSLTGVDSLAHMLFIKNERPDIYQKADKFLEPMDFLTYRLTGKCAATQESMFASGLIGNRVWGSTQYNDQLLKMAGIDKRKLPELIKNGDIVGPVLPSVAEELGLHPSTQVLAGINDTNASAVGSGAVDDSDGVIYIGTSLVLTCHISALKSDILRFMTGLPSPIDSKYLLMAEQGTGGKSLELFLKNIVFADDELNTGPVPDDVYERANRIAEGVPPGSEGVIYLPWLNGSLTPEESETVRGGFINLSLKTNRGHMIRALMEGIAYNNLWTLKPAEKFVGTRFKSFRFAGGGALSDVWAQIHADVLGLPIHRVRDPTNTTTRGAASIGFYKLGLIPKEKMTSLVKIDRVFQPNPENREIYDKMYSHFRKFFKRNKGVFATLNKN